MAFLHVLRLVSRVATAFSKGKPKRKRWNVPPPCTCPGWGQTDTGIRTHTHTHADKRTRESQNRLPEGKSDEIRHDPHVSGWEGRGGGGGGRRARRMRVGGRGEREGGAGGGGDDQLTCGVLNPFQSPTFPSRPFTNVSRLSSATLRVVGEQRGGCGRRLCASHPSPRHPRGPEGNAEQGRTKKERGTNTQLSPFERAGEVASTCSLTS